MPEKKQTKYRHELKYQVTDAQIQMLKMRIRHLLPLDSHVAQTGSYVITALQQSSPWSVSARSGEKPTKPPAL